MNHDRAISLLRRWARGDVSEMNHDRLVDAVGAIEERLGHVEHLMCGLREIIVARDVETLEATCKTRKAGGHTWYCLDVYVHAFWQSDPAARDEFARLAQDWVDAAAGRLLSLHRAVVHKTREREIRIVERSEFEDES